MSKITLASSILAAALAAGGCDNTPYTPPPGDMAVVHDMAKGGGDMAGADMVMVADMAQSGDMAGADMAMPQDLAMADLTVPPDLSGPADLTMTPSTQIQAVIDAAAMPPDGGVALPVSGVLVSYTKPLIGTDAAGFFVQYDMTGPALFVAVDPATLTPVPVPGDKVSFNVNAVALAAMLPEATGIDTFTRISQGNSIAGLVQDLSNAADLVTNVGGYQSELIKCGGTITSAFASAGAGFVQAGIDTGAVVGNANLKLRVPLQVRDDDDLEMGCTVTVGNTPLWRFNAAAQVSGWVDADVTVATCPAPKVVSAVALTNTSVQVTFDRLIDPASVNANGSQFTFDNGLTASAATANLRTVTVTTAAQTGGTTYKVTVDATVKDKLGSGVDQTANSATFAGFQSVATLQINEVNPNLGGSTDLVELLAVSGGTISGATLVQDVATPIVLATLPNLNVATGDLIVVHMTPATNMITTETTTKGDCTAAACYPGAWDIAGNAAGIPFTNHTLSVKSPQGAYQDAAVFIHGGSMNAAYPGDVTAFQMAGQWLPADCGGAACSYTSNPTVIAISVDWTNVAANTGSSVARKANADTNLAADWAVGTASFGATNP
jgi:hypothetical protein